MESYSARSSSRPCTMASQRLHKAATRRHSQTRSSKPWRERFQRDTDPSYAGAAVGAQQNAHARPTGTDLADNARHFLHRSGRAIDVGAAQLRHQQMAAAEDGERQITMA